MAGASRYNLLPRVRRIVPNPSLRTNFIVSYALNEKKIPCHKLIRQAEIVPFVTVNTIVAQHVVI